MSPQPYGCSKRNCSSAKDRKAPSPLPHSSEFCPPSAKRNESRSVARTHLADSASVLAARLGSSLFHLPPGRPCVKKKKGNTSCVSTRQAVNQSDAGQTLTPAVRKSGPRTRAQTTAPASAARGTNRVRSWSNTCPDVRLFLSAARPIRTILSTEQPTPAGCGSGGRRKSAGVLPLLSLLPAYSPQDLQALRCHVHVWS